MRHLLCLLLLIPCLASAQSKGSRTCRVLFLGAPDGAPEKLQLFDGSASQEVELPRMNLSPVYKLPAGPLVIRMLTTAPAKPEAVSPDAPKAAIPEAMAEFYLLVSNDPANKIAPVKLQIIDADPAKFKKGQMMWFNLTPNSVGGQVGTENLAMAANSKTILNAPAAKNGDYNVNLSFRTPGDERLNPLCETKWQYDAGTRTVLFVISQEGVRIPRVLGFPDYREPEETNAKP
ncbi:MAG: hypothetical protein V4819_14540 [Verrucomicrobiota bacterium]